MASSGYTSLNVGAPDLVDTLSFATSLHFTSLSWTADNSLLRSQSQSYFTAGGLLSVSSSWRQAPWDLRPVIVFQLNTCFHSPYVTSPLTRGWVCHLQLVLALASTVILKFESRGTHGHILLSQFRDSSNREGQVPVFISLRTGCASYTPRHWVPCL
jgi:hypothetical protein